MLHSMQRKTTPTTASILIDPRTAADLLGVSYDTLSKWRTRGTGPKYVKLGRGRTAVIRYRREDVEAYIEANLHESTSDRDYHQDTDEASP